MGATTTFLIRWNGGWTDLTNGASPRSEAFLSVGALQSKAEALRVAQAQLNLFGHVQEKLTMGVVADSGVVEPFVPFVPGTGGILVGDTVNAPNAITGAPQPWRVGGISISENGDDGVVTVTPTLIDEDGQWPVDPESAMLQAAKKLANGTLQGTAKVAQPSTPGLTGQPIKNIVVPGP